MHDVDTDLGGNGVHGGGDDGDHVLATAVSIDGGLTWISPAQATPTDSDTDDIAFAHLAQLERMGNFSLKVDYQGAVPIRRQERLQLRAQTRVRGLSCLIPVFSRVRTPLGHER